MHKFNRFPLAVLAAVASFGASSQVYQLTEIDTSVTTFNAFASSINSAGEVALIGQTDVNRGQLPFQPPIDLSLIDLDSELFTNNLTDIESVRNGIFNTEDYEFLALYVLQNTGFLLFQQLAQTQSYVWSNGNLTLSPGFDVIDPELGGFTISTDTEIQAINDSGVTVGNSEGVFTKLDYVNEDGNEVTYVLQDFGRRGYVDLNGTVVGLESESLLAGGFTEANDINDSLLVAGAEILDPSVPFSESIASCDDPEIRGDVPVEACIQNFINSGPVTGHQLRAALWQLDQQGNVIEKIQLGLPFTVPEDDDSLYQARANAVNENGIAVGQAVDFIDGNLDSVGLLYPVVFNGDTVTTMVDTSEFRSTTSFGSAVNGTATDINDNNIATGWAASVINGNARTKFFLYDVDSEEITFPDDFFTGSSSVARAINNNGIVVGEGETDTDLSIRRRSAFVYDSNEDSFQNLNDLIACNSPYTLVQANDINDAGQITATALVNRVVRDINTNVRVDDEGNEVTADQFVSVVLTPIPGGEPANCDPVSEDTPERSGSMTIAALGFLGLISMLRRRVFKK